MLKANQSIRRQAIDAGIKLWQIGDRLGYSDSTFSRLLRKELPDNQQKLVRQAIKELKNETSKTE